MTLRRATQHVTTAMALDYLEGVLETTARSRIEEHLGGPCPGCHERLRELGALVETMRRDRTPEVPADLHARALGVFRPRSRPAAAPGFVEEIARLLFDSRLQPLTATVRRSVGASRRLAFALPGGTLEMELEAEAQELHTLRGRLQIAEPEMQQVEIAIRQERFLLRVRVRMSGSRSGRLDPNAADRSRRPVRDPDIRTLTR